MITLGTGGANGEWLAGWGPRLPLHMHAPACLLQLRHSNAALRLSQPALLAVTCPALCPGAWLGCLMRPRLPGRCLARLVPPRAAALPGQCTLDTKLDGWVQRAPCHLLPCIPAGATPSTSTFLSAMCPAYVALHFTAMYTALQTGTGQGWDGGTLAALKLRRRRALCYMLRPRAMGLVPGASPSRCSICECRSGGATSLSAGSPR